MRNDMLLLISILRKFPMGIKKLKYIWLLTKMFLFHDAVDAYVLGKGITSVSFNLIFDYLKDLEYIGAGDDGLCLVRDVFVHEPWEKEVEDFVKELVIYDIQELRAMILLEIWGNDIGSVAKFLGMSVEKVKGCLLLKEALKR